MNSKGQISNIGENEKVPGDGFLLTKEEHIILTGVPEDKRLGVLADAHFNAWCSVNLKRKLDTMDKIKLRNMFRLGFFCRDMIQNRSLAQNLNSVKLGAPSSDEKEQVQNA